jgi:V8-like Glu-specific endopeptidase
MIKTRSRTTSASTFDDDSPFRQWSPASDVSEFQWSEAAQQPERLGASDVDQPEWFGASDAEQPEWFAASDGERPESFEPLDREQPEWFAATADTETEEEGQNTACTDSGVGIIGRDDRQPVSNTLNVPFRWICQLWIRRRDSNGKVTDTGGTGVLVSPRHVLTAAHAIKEDKQNASNGEWVSYEATQIRVVPGRDGGDRPFDTYNVKLPPQIASGWTPRGNAGSEHDYALLTLDAAAGDKTFKSLGNQKLGYWGSAASPQATAVSQDPRTLAGATGISAGYPNDRGGAVKPFTTSGQLGVLPRQRFMRFTADACQGQSGSPVWVTAGSEFRLVGLLVRVEAAGALVIPITRDVAKQLRDFMGNASDAFKDPTASSSSSSTRETAVWEPEDQQLGESEGEGEAFDAEESTYEDEDESEAFDSGEVLPKEDRIAMAGAIREQLGVEAEPSTPLKIGKLAFLTRIAAPLDPGVYDGPVKYRVADPLQKSLAEAVKKAGTGSAPVALVDLTKDPAAPEFAGWNHKAQVFPASMAKLIPMLAAFQLQSDLRAMQTDLGGAPASDVFAEARKRWVATQTPPAGAAVASVSGDLGRQGELATWKGKPFALPANSTLPNLETIFGTGAGFPFRSTPARLPGSPSCAAECDDYVNLEKVELYGNGGDRQHGFLQRLKLMIGFSNNSAATSCIGDIGFPYIASVLMQTGLWDPARGGGLWVGAGYGGLSWRASPLGGAAVTASAGALAALLTLIARDLAVDSASSAAMRGLFNKDAYPGAYTRSGFKTGLNAELARRGQSPATVFSKLGLLGVEYDCAIIERDEGGKHLKYVAVAMNIASTTAMHKLIVALDQCIRTNNGL